MPGTVFVIRDSSPEGYTCLSLFFNVDAAMGIFLGKSGHPSTLSLPKDAELESCN
jgi:hypothetical protein